MIKTIEDRYEGVTIDSSILPTNTLEFAFETEQLIRTLQNKKLLWVKIPIEKSDFIPPLTKLGFEFHHCDESSLMLVRKLAPNAFIPTTKNFIVGVGAIVLHNNLLLVVKDKFFPGYKLPGGHIDKNESIKEAVKREVFEETGISVLFESIMNIGHFRNGQFGEANLYMACTASALSSDISIFDTSEIIEAKWMPPAEFLNSDEVNNYNKRVVEAALNNKNPKLLAQEIILKVANAEVFF